MRNLAVREVETGAIGPLKVIGHSADVAVGVVDEFVLLLWRRRIVTDGVRWAREAFAKLAVKEDRKFVFLTAVVPGCDISTPTDVRKDIAALLKTYEWQLACAAIVFENNGFGMTIVRSVMTAIQMASRSKFPNAVFGSVESATTWMAAHTEPHDVRLDSARIISAFGHLRTL
ncbi:MAG TPA: hypothetical protein VK762_23295 [Polyangiaceae bacterium]|jgi:hypothetical protein|nr:hypothetical protein [Polyangiaceae bacterium]